MKRSTLIATLVGVGFASTIAAAAFAFAQTPRFFLFQLGRAIDSDNVAQVESLIDIDRTTDDYVTTAIKFLKADVLTQAQTTGNGFEALGGMLALGAADSMADGLKVQLATVLRDNLDATLDRWDRPVTQYLLTQSVQKTGRDTATVTIARPDGIDWNSPLDSLEVELERANGRWQVVGLSDRTIRAAYQAQQANTTQPSGNQSVSPATPVSPVPHQSQSAASASPQLLPPSSSTPVQAPVAESTAESTIGQIATLTADSATARINLRDEPSADIPTQRYGLVGDQVLVQAHSLDSDGRTWYKVKFQVSGAVGWVRGDFVAF